MANPLLKRLIGEGETPAWNEPWQEEAFNQLKARYINDYTKGFTAVNGEVFPPRTPEEAEAEWNEKAPKFIAVILNAQAPDVENYRRIFTPRRTRDWQHKSEVSTPSPQTGKQCPHCGGAL